MIASSHRLSTSRAGKLFVLLCLVVLAFRGKILAAPADEPTAADILRTVREAQGSRHETLDGQLRTGDGKVIPFRLAADGAAVRYQFPGPPPTTIRVRYNEDNSQLEESTGGDSERMTPANFDKKIFGTDLSYEDLSLRFVYWKRAALLPGDSATLPLSSYKIRLDAPSRQSQYSYVLLWVGKESGALLEAEGYDLDGKLTKRLKVINGQKLSNGKWYLKSLRIEDIDTATGRASSRSYLEIKGLVTPMPPVR